MIATASLPRRLMFDCATASAIVLALTGCVGGSPQIPGGSGPTGGVVRGQVTTVDGRPVAGAEVFADNVEFYNTNLTTFTDDSGNYEIKIESTNIGKWRVGGYKTIEIDGVKLRMALHPKSGGAFSGSDGAVRDLEWRLSGSTIEGGYYGSDVWVYSNLSSEEVPTDSVELTLMPIGTLVDGSVGETLIRTPSIRRIGDVPLGSYVVSARYLDAPEPIELLIRIRDSGEPAKSVESRFRMNQYEVVQLELEVSWPLPH